jgi:hypothetical protein
MRLGILACESILLEIDQLVDVAHRPGGPMQQVKGLTNRMPSRLYGGERRA